MTMHLQEPGRMDEPIEAQEYADVLSRVAANHEAVILQRGGTDLAAIIPLDYLEVLLDTLARQEAERISGTLDWDRLVIANTPPQEWFDHDEPKPF